MSTKIQAYIILTSTISFFIFVQLRICFSPIAKTQTVLCRIKSKSTLANKTSMWISCIFLVGCNDMIYPSLSCVL